MRAVLTSISVFTDDDTAVDVAVTVGFAPLTGTGPDSWTLPSVTALNDGIAFFHPGIKTGTGDGFTIGNGSGIVGYGAKDESVVYTHTAATDGSLSIHVVGYFAEAQQVAT